MKNIKVKIEISVFGKVQETVELQKESNAEEIKVLAAAISTIFLKSEEALKIANKNYKKIKA